MRQTDKERASQREREGERVNIWTEKERKKELWRQSCRERERASETDRRSERETEKFKEAEACRERRVKMREGEQIDIQ